MCGTHCLAQSCKWWLSVDITNNLLETPRKWEMDAPSVFSLSRYFLLISCFIRNRPFLYFCSYISKVIFLFSNQEKFDSSCNTYVCHVHREENSRLPCIHLKSHEAPLKNRSEFVCVFNSFLMFYFRTSNWNII